MNQLVEDFLDYYNHFGFKAKSQKLKYKNI